MRDAVLLLAAFAAGLVGGLLSTVFQPEPAPKRASRPEATVETAELPEQWRDLEERIRALEAAAAARHEAAPRGAVPVPEGQPGAAQPEEKPPADPLDGLLGQPFGATSASRLFNRLIQNPDRFDATVDRLRKEIEKDPKNAELHVALATALLSRIASMAPSPQQGMLWMEASASYDKAIELEPNHWQARYGKAFGTSMAPEFVGMRPEAIRQFEELVAIQETQALAPEHAQVYYRLGTLYKDAGNPAKAREIWAKGRKLFPDNVSMKEAMELLDG
jgi:tetratricopeptide (TPR) repeat protein